ncbi:MAG: BrnA antitoxin family protein [Acidobacteriota bacterium]|nr:BrnA antitoxin family protein [Acidobacteriota bacterium]
MLEFFRETGPRYQSRMNAVLRSYMERTGISAPKRSKGARDRLNRRWQQTNARTIIM